MRCSLLSALLLLYSQSGFACLLERSGVLGTPIGSLPQLGEMEFSTGRGASTTYELPADLLCPQRGLLGGGNVTLSFVAGTLWRVVVEQVGSTPRLGRWLQESGVAAGMAEMERPVGGGDHYVSRTAQRLLRYRSTPLESGGLLEQLTIESVGKATERNRVLLRQEGHQ